MASILALQTPVLVLDEATGQLDDGRAMGLYKLLRSLADDGRTVLVTDNRYEMIAEYCDRVIVADGGHVVSAGAPRDIFPLLEVVGLVGTTRFIQAVRHLEQHSLWSSTWGYPATLEGAVERCRLVSSSTFKG
jgi:ABC-type multidrug transport system ATPase subunit